MNYDRIILEVLERISKLEDEIKELKEKKQVNVNSEGYGKSEPTAQTKKDKTKYILDGRIYVKNRLALAIVKKYVDMHPDVTADQLLGIFDKSLQGSFGAVQKFKDVKHNYKNLPRRFFTEDDEIIKTKTDLCVVCSQWGIYNIGNIIERARQLGIEVSAVK